MGENERYHLEVIGSDGTPLAPAKNVTHFVSQCGVVVRDNVPISTREWQKRKKEEVSYVDDRTKDTLWTKLMVNFTLPPEVDARKVKEWALKKMAQQFNNWKKRMNNDYIQKGKTPEFIGVNEKLKAQWEEFVEYKNSQEFKNRSEKNKENASKKKYHHNMGSGGYARVEPMMDKDEEELLAKDVQPETLNWAYRAKLWFYGHGGRLDPTTGKCIFTKEQIKTPIEALREIMEKVEAGTFHPDREKDEPTEALGNDEHEAQ